MAGVPHAARALVGTIPSAVLNQPEPITLKAILNDFQLQLKQDPVSRLIENIMQTGSTTFVMHCHTPLLAEEARAIGFTFRDFQIDFKPASNVQWIKLTRVVYGTPEEAIKTKLSDFGTVYHIRQEKIHGVGISVYSVRIDLKKPIPSRITLNNAPVNVFYRGQPQQCFRCEQVGHLSRHCPFRRNLSTEVPPRIIGPNAISTDQSKVPPENAIPVPDLPSPPTELPDPPPPVTDIPPPVSDLLLPVPDLPASETSSESTFVEKAPGKRLRKDYPPNHAPPPPAPMDTESVIPPKGPVDNTSSPASSQDSEPLPVVSDETIASWPRDYVFYERFRAGWDSYPNHFSGENLEKYKALIDPDTLARYERTYIYRQPRHAKAAELRPFLDYYDRMVYPLGNIEDLSDTEFIHPTLPAGCVEDPELSYVLFEKLILRRFVAARFPKMLQQQPSWTKAASDRLEQIDEKLFVAYNVNFVLQHPAHMTLLEHEGWRQVAEQCILAESPIDWDVAMDGFDDTETD